MLAQALLKSGRGVNGSAFFVDGMSSAADPLFIGDRAYRASMNTVHRGGLIKTRPGYRQIFTLPTGKLQGVSYFRPLVGTPFLVFAVAGVIYSSIFPFTTYTEIEGISLYAHAPKVYFATATRSAELQDDGSIQSIAPKRVLIMQDGGYTAPVWFDGNGGGRLDPGANQTPLGGPLRFSGDRLWQARGNKLFASDISDPFSFVENIYAAEGGFFIFPENIVALEEIPSLDSPTLIVFCENSTHLIQSGLRDRSTWKETNNFQRPLFPGVGCTSHRSVVAQFGLLWWMSRSGLTNFNAAAQARVSSRLSPQDTAMAVSKVNLSPDLSNVALGVLENYLLASVPYGDRYNAHTWVLDQAVVSEVEKESNESWSSYWTGTRPVEWASGVFNNVQRLFHVSVDEDGENRLWEAFTPDRVDNETPITSFVETKTHIDFSPQATGLDKKRFLFGEVHMVDIVGPVDVAIYWASTRGKYHKLGDWHLEAAQGSPRAGVAVDNPSTYRPQSRLIRTPEVQQTKDDTCSSCGVESDLDDWMDIGFSLLIVWTGQAALRSYRIFVDPRDESGTGEKAYDETGETNVVAGVECPPFETPDPPAEAALTFQDETLDVAIAQDDDLVYPDGFGGESYPVTITNTGDTTLEVASVTLDNPTDFTVQTDPSGNPILAAGTETLVVALTAIAPGTYTTTVTIASDDAGSPFVYTITVTIGGLPPPPGP